MWYNHILVHHRLLQSVTLLSFSIRTVGLGIDVAASLQSRESCLWFRFPTLSLLSSPSINQESLVFNSVFLLSLFSVLLRSIITLFSILFEGLDFRSDCPLNRPLSFNFLFGYRQITTASTFIWSLLHCFVLFNSCLSFVFSKLRFTLSSRFVVLFHSLANLVIVRLVEAQNSGWECFSQISL